MLAHSHRILAPLAIAAILSIALMAALSGPAKANLTSRSSKVPGPAVDAVILDCRSATIAVRIVVSENPEFPFTLWLGTDEAGIRSTMMQTTAGLSLSGRSIAHDADVAVLLVDDNLALLSVTRSGADAVPEPGACTGQSSFLDLFGSAN